MGSSISFYGSEADCRLLESYAETLGLHLIAPVAGKTAPALAKEGSYCYLSMRAVEELHPYGTPLRYTDAKDPLLRFMRPYYADPYLVLGHIYRSTDVASISSLTDLPFRGIKRWVKANWAKHGDLYIGPGAGELIARGAQMVNVLPGTASSKVVEY
ncbi:hypothetical protein [Dyella japonica]|uniref:hypothetical protein n=1 Tax=Dyella japonica TaxID=231455 RepID=UPI000584E2EC|nr:hypothetical protein [Dyella japonica]